MGATMVSYPPCLTLCERLREDGGVHRLLLPEAQKRPPDLRLLQVQDWRRFVARPCRGCCVPILAYYSPFASWTGASSRHRHRVSLLLSKPLLLRLRHRQACPRLLRSKPCRQQSSPSLPLQVNSGSWYHDNRTYMIRI